MRASRGTARAALFGDAPVPTRAVLQPRALEPVEPAPDADDTQQSDTSTFPLKTAALPAFDIFEDPTLSGRSFISATQQPVKPQLPAQELSFAQSTPFLTDTRFAVCGKSSFPAPSVAAPAPRPAAMSFAPRNVLLTPIAEISHENASFASVNASTLTSAFKAPRPGQMAASAPVSSSTVQFPLSDNAKIKLLSSMTQSLAAVPGCSIQMSSVAPRVAVGSVLQLSGQPSLTVSASKDASTFIAGVEFDQSHELAQELSEITVDVSSVPCPWSFYITRQAHTRAASLPSALQRGRHSIANAHFVNMFSNGCIIGFDYGDCPTMQEVVELNSKQGRQLVRAFMRGCCTPSCLLRAGRTAGHVHCY